MKRGGRGRARSSAASASIVLRARRRTRMPRRHLRMRAFFCIMSAHATRDMLGRHTKTLSSRLPRAACSSVSRSSRRPPAATRPGKWRARASVLRILR